MSQILLYILWVVVTRFAILQQYHHNKLSLHDNRVPHNTTCLNPGLQAFQITLFLAQVGRL